MINPDNVVFFDSACNLCNGSVNFLIKNDQNRALKYSSLQGKLIKTFLVNKNIDIGSSLVFLSDGKIYLKSEAIIKILFKLNGLYKLLGIIGSVLPYSLLNIFYDLIAKNRYKLFGKNEVCRTNKKKYSNLFID